MNPVKLNKFIRLCWSDWKWPELMRMTGTRMRTVLKKVERHECMDGHERCCV